VRGLWIEPTSVAAVASEVNSSMLSVSVRKVFPSAARSSTAFALDVSAEFPAGVTVLFGPSGAGKSTILDCIAGLQRPDAGLIRLDDVILFDGAQRKSLRPAERKIAYVLQTLALFPHLTVEENVAYGLHALPRAEQASRVESGLKAFRVEGLRGRKPAQISGGEKQRVALARSLVTQPRALLLDEPLTGLDAGLKSAIMDDLRAWNQANGIPIVYVTHTHDEVLSLGERVVGLEAGRVVQTGTPREILGAPRTRLLADAGGYENFLEAVIVERRPEDGVMRVQLSGKRMELEVPIMEGERGDRVGIAIRAGDILVANEEPRGLSARNVLAGRIASIEARGYVVALKIEAGVQVVAHVTPGAVRALSLENGKPVWTIIKTHSCHLVKV
jgi:molybdate transport system ATP-binding protein